MNNRIKVYKYLYRMGLNSLLTTRLFETEKKLHYSKNVSIGWLDYPTREMFFDINFGSEPKRIMILGRSGSGKSWIMRGITDRCYWAGLKPVIMTDIAPEYYTSQFPLQEKFKFLLDKREMPKGLPMKIYYPYFLYKKFSEQSSIKGQQIFQFDIDSIRPSDLASFMNYEELSLTSKAEVEELINSIENKKLNSIQDLYKLFAQKEIHNKLVKIKIMKMLSNLKMNGVFGKNYPPADFVADINNGYVPVMNLFGWTDMNDYKRYVSIYFSIILRRILNSKELGLIKPKEHLVIEFEELHAFAPRRTETTAEDITRKEIIQAVLTGRKYNISFIFATQSPETVHSAIIEQCNYIFVPYSFERSKIMDIIKNRIPAFHDTPYEFGLKVTDQLRNLKRYRDGVRDWLCLDIEKGDVYPFTPLAPLSHHRTEGDMIGRV